MSESPFTRLPDDVLLKVLFMVEDDPRDWARLACVSTKLSTLIRAVCWRSRCLSLIPSVAADLSAPSTAGDRPPGGWAALYKITVCCPGLLHAGVLPANSDRELGPDEIYTCHLPKSTANAASGSNCCPGSLDFETASEGKRSIDNGDSPVICKRRKRSEWSPKISHLASGSWSLSREQGNKLLASRFREDSLYICDWPGCIHMMKKRNYMLFRGIFKNFKRSRVWRTIEEGHRRKTDLNCAYCECKETWDLHSAFCLRRVFAFHDDGVPEVRAYVCENGHVSGAWTDLPIYM